MGPFEDIGTYAEVSITTRQSDANRKTDNEPGFADIFIGLFGVLLSCIIWWVIGCTLIPPFIGLFIPAIFIGPLFFGRYLWSHKPLRRSRTFTPSQRAAIKRRISDLPR